MDINALLKQAKDERGQTVVKCHVALVKAYGEYNKLGGEEDYRSSLKAIVAAYGTDGVKYSLVREVLHDTEKLNAAVESLVDAKEITKGNGKRDFLLNALKKPSDELAILGHEPEKVEPKNEGSTPPQTPMKTTSKSTEPVEDDTQE